jgi:hypothetical protein
MADQGCASVVQSSSRLDVVPMILLAAFVDGRRVPPVVLAGRIGPRVVTRAGGGI